jgi:AcrR family transcriptional regulator
VPKVSDEYRDARRAQVLGAARRCFVRDGFHVTSIADICREAGVSPGVVYLYFASKDEIITAIAAQNLDGVAEAARRLAHEHAEQGVGVVLAELLAYLRAEHERNELASIALLVWSESLRNKALAQRLQDASTELRATFATLVRDVDAASSADAETDADADADADTDTDTDDTVSAVASFLVGYIMQLATLPTDLVASMPDVVKTLWAQPAAQAVVERQRSSEP